MSAPAPPVIPGTLPAPPAARAAPAPVRGGFGEDLGLHAEHATAFTFLSFFGCLFGGFLIFQGLFPTVTWFFFLHLPRLHSQYSRFQFDIWADALTTPVPSLLIFNPPPQPPHSRPSHLKCSGSETNSFQRPPKATPQAPTGAGIPSPVPADAPSMGWGSLPAAAFLARKSGKVFLFKVLPVFSHR